MEAPSPRMEALLQHGFAEAMVSKERQRNPKPSACRAWLPCTLEALTVFPSRTHCVSAAKLHFAASPFSAQVGIIGADRKFRVLSEAEVADYLQEVE
eukprot:1154577-Pelagomonas_calceolata.AAC.2